MTRDRIGALFFLAVSIAYGVVALDIRVPPFVVAQGGLTGRSLPIALAGAGTLVAFLMLVLPSKAGAGARPAGGPFAGWGGLDWPRVVTLGLDMLVYGYLLTRIGFMASTWLFLIVGFVVLGERRPHVLLLASIPVVVVFWVILSQLLGIYLGHVLGSWGAALTQSTGGGG
ncbi:MAG: tripartite tricarboxylate transporter TctB family protein [Alphaproteobacteria bacterium]